MSNKVRKSETEWCHQLTPEQLRVSRERGTEKRFSGEYNNCETAGTYDCICRGQSLFSSDTKFDAGTGRPGFWAAISTDAVITRPDDRCGTDLTEVLCERRAAHLGHVFLDGPKPSGQRYCINSVALKLRRS
ncbi:MAG: peptide-methionine (R)-S-oxide reductase MsrB [Gammaproteobacteria bacterium]|nr:peptide-methionine (R)-S-oxide reductase MsrB [Gammaproteobacteria bacterium]